MWRAVPLLAVLAVCVPVAAYGQGPSLGDFNPMPELPYEATSLDQDDLIQIADKLLGDKAEEAPRAACEALRRDASAPWELRRWATLRELQLLTYMSHEGEAVALGEEWLCDNPEDPGALEIRTVMGQIVAQRGHAGFMPTLEEVDAVFKPIFENYDAHEWNVIVSRIQYAEKLGKLAAFQGYSTMLLSAERLVLARQALEEVVADPARSEVERTRAKSCLEQTVLPLIRGPVRQQPVRQEVHSLQEMKALEEEWYREREAGPKANRAGEE